MNFKAIGFVIIMAAISIAQVKVVSPNGGEHYDAAQDVAVRWTKAADVSLVLVEYSCDSGATWNTISLTDSVSCIWVAAAGKTRIDHGLIRVTAQNYAGHAVDTSDGCFTIEAALPDAYEPNNNFSSAHSIYMGDSVVKNALAFESPVCGPDGKHVVDTLTDDIDYFKVAMQGGPMTTISAFTYSSSMNAPIIELYNDSYELLNWAQGTLNCYIARAGNFYLKVAPYGGGQSCRYGLSIHQGTHPITIIAPNGGESYGPGEKVTIKWTTAIPRNEAVQALYSLDNGTSWIPIGATAGMDYGDSSIEWTVPYLKQQATSVKVKAVLGFFSASAFDVSNNTFAIRASPVDAYEPNDNFASAYPISIGDSVVKNATILSPDSSLLSMMMGPDTANTDEDFYKVALTAGKLVTVTSIPWFASGSNDQGPTYPYGGAFPYIELYDSLKNLVGNGSTTISCAIAQSGVYYCKIMMRFAGQWSNYGLSIKSVTIISSQKSTIDTTAFQSMGGEYSMHLTTDTTKLTVALMLDKKMSGSIATRVLAPDGLSAAADMKVKVKAISISADTAFSASIKSADIAIPYNAAELSGNPQTSLTVLWLNDSTLQWKPIDCTIDTNKHQIVAHTTHFSIFGVFVKANTGIRPVRQLAPAAFNITANYIAPTRSIVMRFSLPQAIGAHMMLYNIQGECVRKDAFFAGLGNSIRQWNVGDLSNGKYFLTMKAGTYNAKEAILIMR